MRKYIRASSQPDLGLEYIRKLAVPLPPLAEQEQVTAEVERRLSVLTQLEAIVEAGIRRSERLRQSILSKAFAGRLVPQDLNDEPARELILRIREQHNASPGTRSATASQLDAEPPRETIRRARRKKSASHTAQAVLLGEER